MRAREIREIRTSLLAGESVRLVAPRETGRTHLLREVGEEMGSRGFTVMHLTGRRSFREQSYAALREAGLVSLRGAQRESDIAGELAGEIASVSNPLFLIDDADDLDLTSAYVLEQARSAHSIPVVVVGPPFVMLDAHGRSAINRIRTQARFELRPLGYAQISLLAQRVLGAPAQPEVLAQVLTMSSGMAGIAVAILRSAAKEQHIVRHESGWSLNGQSLWNPHLRSTVEGLLGDLTEAEFRALHALALAESVETELFQQIAAPELLLLSQRGLITTFADPNDGTRIAPRPAAIADYFQHRPIDPLHYEAIGLLGLLPNPQAQDRALAGTDARVARTQTFDLSENLGSGMARSQQAETTRRLAVTGRAWNQDPSIPNAVAYLELLLDAGDYAVVARDVFATTPRVGTDRIAVRYGMHYLFWMTLTGPEDPGELLRDFVAAEANTDAHDAYAAFAAYLLFTRFGMTQDVIEWYQGSAGGTDRFRVAVRHYIGVVSGQVNEELPLDAIAGPGDDEPHGQEEGSSTEVPDMNPAGDLPRFLVDIAHNTLRSQHTLPEVYEARLRTSFAQARAASDQLRTTVIAYFLAQHQAATFRDALATETVSVTLAIGTPNLALANFYAAQLRWAAYLHYLHGEPDLARSVLAETSRYPGVYGPMPAMHPEFGDAIELLVTGEIDGGVDVLVKLSEHCHQTMLADSAWTYAGIAFTERPSPGVFAQLRRVAAGSVYGSPELMGLVQSALEEDMRLARIARTLATGNDITTAVSLLGALQRDRRGSGEAPSAFTEVLAGVIQDLRTLLVVGGRRAAEEREEARTEVALTKREHEIAMLAATLQNREIAQRLSLSVRTVENHLARAMKKLGVRSRTDLSASVTVGSRL